MIKSFFLIIVMTAISLGSYLYVYLGFSHAVNIRIDNQGPFYALSIEHLGAYHQINDSIVRVENWMRDKNFPCPQTYAEFLDDPERVDQDRLRSQVGCLLTEPTYRAIEQMSSTPAEWLKLSQREPHRYVVADFDGSPSISPFKVYPKIKEFVQSQRLKATGPYIEIYEINGNQVRTIYLLPIE